jgi:hypothetical protein
MTTASSANRRDLFSSNRGEGMGYSTTTGCLTRFKQATRGRVRKGLRRENKSDGY